MEKEDKPQPRYQFMAKKALNRYKEDRSVRRSYREAYNDAIRDRDDNEARQLAAEGCIMFHERSPYLSAFKEAEEEAALEQDEDEYDENF